MRVCAEPVLRPGFQLRFVRRRAGLILGLEFDVTFDDLSHVQIECDLPSVEGATSDETAVYRHVFTDTGCGDSLFTACLAFGDSVTQGTNCIAVDGVNGCERVRILVQRPIASQFALHHFTLRTAGCKQGMYKACTHWRLALATCLGRIGSRVVAMASRCACFHISSWSCVPLLPTERGGNEVRRLLAGLSLPEHALHGERDVRINWACVVARQR